mgnify:CR=1 FL=1
MIDKEKLASILAMSLDDRSLSLDERHGLKELVGTHASDRDSRAFVRNRVFDMAKQASAGDDALALLDWAHDVIKAVEAQQGAKAELEVFFSPGDDCLQAIERQLRGASTRADICVFTITDDRIVSAICECAARGVAVRIISDNDKSLDRGSDIQRLKKSGVPVRLDKSDDHMHHKFAVFDGTKVLTGSYNWTRSAATRNRENLMTCDDPRAAASYQKEFDSLWAKFGA